MTESKRRGLAALTHSLTPFVTVLVCGLIGGYLVYDNYLTDRGAAEQVVGFEPASGMQSPAKTATAANIAPPVITTEGDDADNDGSTPTFASGAPAH